MGLIRRGRDLALEADWYGWLMHVGNNISHIWMQRTTASAWRGSRALSLISRDIKIISRKRSHTACLIHFISYTATSLNPRSFVPPSVHPFQHLHCPSITEAHVILSFSCPANRIGRFTWKTQTLCKKKKRPWARLDLHNLVARRWLRRTARWLHTAHSALPPHCSGFHWWPLCFPRRLSQSLFIKHYKVD